jgi:hypothetical protein
MAKVDSGLSRHNTSIYFALTPKSEANLRALVADGKRSTLVRALIYDDLLDATKNPDGMKNNRLCMYREAVGKRLRNHNKWRVRLPVELRHIALTRSRLLGFTMTEYVVALIARHSHREGLTRGVRYVREY